METFPVPQGGRGRRGQTPTAGGGGDWRALHLSLGGAFCVPRAVLRGKFVVDSGGGDWSGRPPRSIPEDELILRQKRGQMGMVRPRTRALKEDRDAFQPQL